MKNWEKEWIGLNTFFKYFFSQEIGHLVPVFTLLYILYLIYMFQERLEICFLMAKCHNNHRIWGRNEISSGTTGLCRVIMQQEMWEPWVKAGGGGRLSLNSPGINLPLPTVITAKRSTKTTPQMLPAQINPAGDRETVTMLLVGGGEKKVLPFSNENLRNFIQKIWI